LASERVGDGGTRHAIDPFSTAGMPAAALFHQEQL